MILTPRFAALLLIISSTHAAFLPRHDFQAPFHIRAIPEPHSSIRDMYAIASQVARNIPLLLPRSYSPKSSRKISSGKKPSNSKKAKPMIVPVPKSAKPKSDGESSKDLAVEPHAGHVPGKHHRNSRGRKHGKSGVHESKKKSGKSKGHKKHGGRDITVEAEVNVKRGHVDDDIDDDDHGNHHHHHHHHHHTRSENGLYVDAEVDLKRSNDYRHHHLPHQDHKRETPSHALVLYDIGHQNFGKTYHIHGRRDSRDHDHTHRYDRVHGHKHGHKRSRHMGGASLLARSHKHEHVHEDDHVHKHVHVHKHEHLHRRNTNTTRVSGVMEVVSPMEDGGHKKIANLIVSNATNSTGATNASFVLNASNDTQTQVFLVPENSSARGKAVQASIQVDVFNPKTVKVESQCVSYDPSPNAPTSMSVTKCGPSSKHASQLFEFNPENGIVKPLWAPSDAAVENAGSQVSGANITAANLAVANVSSSVANTSAPVGVPSTAAFDHDSPQTVALVFKPDDPEMPKTAANVESDPDAGVEDPAAAAAMLDNGYSATTFYPQANMQGNGTANTTTADAAMLTNTTSVNTTSVDSAAALANNATTINAAAAAASSSSSVPEAAVTSSTMSMTPASAADMVSSESAAAQSTPSAQPVEGVAPYEYMFTPHTRK